MTAELWEPVRCEAGGLTLAGVVIGPAAGAPVLCLHGWLDNAASFQRIAPLFPTCRVLCVDLRGHGLSQHQRVAPYTPWDYCSDLLAWLEQMQWSRVILVGHSLGAGIAALFAATFPEHVRALWCLEGFGPWTDSTRTSVHRLRTGLLKWRAIEARHMQGESPRYPTRDAAVAARMQSPVGAVDRACAEALVGRGLVRASDGFHWRADPLLRVPSMVRLTEQDVLALVAAIEAPTRVALGQEGLFQDRQTLDARIAECRGARVETFAGGHHVHWGAEVERLAAWFLESLEQA